MNPVADAMRRVDRRRFLPPEMRHLADCDQPLPIGYGATNSQPWTVHYMLEQLDVWPGQRILDVGSGSGWTTALLADLTGPTGAVVGVEIVPELVRIARANLGEDWPWASIQRADPGALGWPPQAPYDRILVSADGGRIPEALEVQLRAGGRMVIPANHEMWVVSKDEEGALTRFATGDRFTFVELR